MVVLVQGVKEVKGDDFCLFQFQLLVLFLGIKGLILLRKAKAERSQSCVFLAVKILKFFLLEHASLSSCQK